VSNKLQVWTPIVPIGVILVAFCISGSTIDPSDIYLPQLKDKNAEVRIEALRHLQTFLDSRIPEAMLPLLSDEGNSIRRLAARAIGSRWWQIPKEKSESYVNALAQNLRSELEFEDEKNIAERNWTSDEELWFENVFPKSERSMDDLRTARFTVFDRYDNLHGRTARLAAK